MCARLALPAIAMLILFGSSSLADNPPAGKTDAVAGSGPRELIIGKWQPAETKEKTVLEFMKDGKLKVVAEQITIDGAYKFVDDKTIEVKIAFGGEEKTVKLAVTVTKDELTTQEGDKKKESFKRVK